MILWKIMGLCSLPSHTDSDAGERAIYAITESCQVPNVHTALNEAMPGYEWYYLGSLVNLGPASSSWLAGSRSDFERLVALHEEKGQAR